MQKDEGKGGSGKHPALNKSLFGKPLTEPPALSPEVLKVLSFMRGEPVELGEISDAREALFFGHPKKPDSKKG